MRKICIALDVSDPNFSVEFFTASFPEDVVFKFGLEYFTKFGMPPKIKQQIFLDLKLFDIPNTIYHAVKNVCKGIDFLTISPHGGAGSIKAAVDAKNEINPGAKIICVTKLTSEESSSNEIMRLTEMAINIGADGIVCSALEAQDVRKHFGEYPIIITPAIRPSWYRVKDDQVRTCTPKEAFDNGSNILVIGRPITKAPDPLEAFNQIMRDV